MTRVTLGCGISFALSEVAVHPPGAEGNPSKNAKINTEKTVTSAERSIAEHAGPRQRTDMLIVSTEIPFLLSGLVGDRS
jgi:hypothetical protein